jgi:ferredoxin-NADP reductase
MMRRPSAVEVIGIEQVTPLIKHFKLAPVGGGSLPVFSGGSHIIVVMQGASRVHKNPYSLLGSPQQLDSYEIGVRRMEESRGGSHFMHDSVKVGSRLEIAHPVNLFGLDKIARKHVLIAGGIGITPFSRSSRTCTAAAFPMRCITRCVRPSTPRSWSACAAARASKTSHVLRQ